MEPQRVEDLQKKPDEFALAGISFLSFLFGSFIFSGVMLAVCKDKCEYLRFQIAQCLATQVLVMVGMMLYLCLFFCVIFFTVFTSAATHGPPLAVFAIIPVHFLVIFGMIGINFTLAIVGMLKAFPGKDFAIPLVGAWVFRRFFMGKRPPA